MTSLQPYSKLRLVRENPSAPHPTAQRVIDLLSEERRPDLSDIAAVRRHYNLSRRQFLGEMEQVESVTHICAPDVPRLTVFRPKDFRIGDLAPALVYLHGGGWSLGSLATYEPLCRHLANACGAVVIWVEYRLAPEHPFPAAYDDALAAWRWIRENHHELRIDPHRIALAGDSAGGNLAAATTLRLRNIGMPMPWRQILLYPCLDLTASLPSHERLAQGYLLTQDIYAWYRGNYVKDADPADWRLSPLFSPDLSGLPPTILLHAGFDPLTDEAVAFARRLEQDNVAVETLYFPDMIHGFLTMGGLIPAATMAIQRIGASLNEVKRHRA